MQKFRFDFDLDIWMQLVEIEANSYEEAKEKLFQMSAEEIVKVGYVKDFNIKQIDCEEIE